MKRARTPSSLSATLVPYLLAFTISWVLVAIGVFFGGNANLFLWLNAIGNPLTDRFFSFITLLGDGGFFAVVCVALLFWHRRSGLAALVAFGFSSAVSALLKRTLFDDWVRPKAFFEGIGTQIRIPDGEVLHSYNSFPSGHTTSIFSLACLLAFYFPNPRYQIGFLAVAWLVGLSRVMVGQHFPLDVLGGALLGTGCSILVRDAFFKWGLARKLGITGKKKPADSFSETSL
jgi:membrane-associated phospholipid phosphatase